MKVMMEVLISKFDKMISRKEVPSRKEKEVEMPIIKAIVNFKGWWSESCYEIGKKATKKEHLSY